MAAKVKAKKRVARKPKEQAIWVDLHANTTQAVIQGVLPALSRAVVEAIRANWHALAGPQGATGHPGATTEQLEAVMRKIREFDHVVALVQNLPTIQQLRESLAVQTSHVRRLLAEKDALMRDLRLARYDLSVLRAADERLWWKVGPC